jgi:hypothetical protein
LDDFFIGNLHYSYWLPNYDIALPFGVDGYLDAYKLHDIALPPSAPKGGQKVDNSAEKRKRDISLPGQDPVLYLFLVVGAE